MISSRKELEELFRLEADAMDLTVDVFSDGPVNAEIALVGEGPGENEMRQHLPFVGGSGRFLWGEGRKYDIFRHTVYVSNVVKRQISLSSVANARHAVGREELSKWIAMVQWELQQLPNLKFVFLMGNYALQAFTSHTGITNWRGSVLDIQVGDKFVKAVCAFNPAYCLREPKFEPIFTMDLHKFSRVINGTFKEYAVTPTINPSFGDVLKYLDGLAKSPGPCSLDIETTGNEVACVGLSTDPHSAFCINFRDDRRSRFSISEEAQIWQRLQQVIPKQQIIAQQTGAFDAYYCWLKSYLKFDVYFDTLLAHHLLFPQLPHSLAFIVSQYTTHPFYKDEGKLWREGGDIDVFWQYNCKDAALTFKAYQCLLRDLQKYKLDNFFFSHVMRLQPHLVQATVHGVACDLERKKQISETLSEEVAKLKARFNELVADATDDEDYIINPNSPSQLAELLFTKLNLRGRGTSTDETQRKRLLADERVPGNAKEILTVLDKYKKESKFLGTYADSKVDRDGRFRTVYRQHGVQRAPGRLSSSQTIDKTGMNLQNQPQRAYGMFMADPGCCFIYFDAKAAEAHVIASYYDIEKWKEDFERAKTDPGFDIHRSLAAQMYKKPYSEVPKDDYDKDGHRTIRYIAKRSRYGLSYRMQATRFSEVTDLPFHEARRAFHLYHVVTPELRRGWKREEEKVRRVKELYNAFGRPWKVLQRLDETVLESIIAFYPQSTIGDKVSRVWYLSEEDEEWPVGHARIAMNNHDALIGISEHKYAMKALSIMKKHMEEPITITNIYGSKTEKIIIPAECKISVPDEQGVHRWSGLKEIKLD
ncbi:MAG: DNA polymerase [Nitrososphaera sp.]|nr:DNA polymerase [Nitrososphaera sp.]